MDLIDLGLRIGPDDFPAPFKVICDAFDSLVLDGTIESAEATVQTLLVEAQEARQWSIPWGARVEVTFGPFIAVQLGDGDRGRIRVMIPGGPSGFHWVVT